MQSQKLAEAVQRVTLDVPPLIKSVGLALTVLGAVAFGAALFVDYDAAWRAYLTAWVYFTGLALGAVVWSAILRITSARWGRSLMRFFEAPVAFLPVAGVLFVGLVIGGWTSHIYEWVHHPIHHKEAWLTPGFLFGREAVILAITFCVALLYVYNSLKADVRVLKGNRNAPAFFQRLFDTASGSEEEWAATQKRLVRLSIVYAFAFALGSSAIAFDLIMSLEPYWYSAMFGGHYFSGNMLMGLAFVTIAAGALRGRGLLEKYIGPLQFWDVGKLVFAFTMVWTYLMWSQYLPIWYGNMHEEIGWVIKRTEGPYEAWAYLLLGMIWLLPWVILIPRASKERPLIAGTAASIILLGMWLERWTMIVPSQFPEAPVAPEIAVFPGWIDIGTMALFAGLFMLSCRFFLKSAPILPVGDPVFQHVVEHGSHGHH